MIQTGAEYHGETSYDRQHMDGHFLDWANQPNPFKNYAGIQAIPLTPVSRYPEKSLWDLTSQPANLPEPTALNKDLISQLLYLAGGLTAKSRQAGKDFYFRSVASAGALYPAEMYVGVFDTKDLGPGMYHFGADNFSLTPLRNGNFSRFLNEMIDAPTLDRQPSASFFLTGIFFRSAWKYRTRAFRYVLLDTGHLLENLILALASVNLAFTCHYDFSDEKVSRLIGLDSGQEVGLVCVNVLGKPLPATQVPSAQDSTNVDPLPSKIIMASQVSSHEVAYDDIIKAYQAGIPEPASHRTESTMMKDIGVSPRAWVPIETPDPDDEEHPYAQSIISRRSKRNYINQSLSQKKFMRLLDLLCGVARPDEEGNPFLGLTVGFLSGNIDGFEPGFYLLDPEKKRAGQVISGDFLYSMASVCLDQRWLANAAIHFLFMTNLKALDHHYGPRGYRYAMLNAGRLGQLIYLGTTALGLGCCGIGALYDGEAQKCLGLNKDSALLYLVAAGPVKSRPLDRDSR